MCSERSDALERDAHYEGRSNLFVGVEAAELLDLAEQCREDAQRLRERPHEHLAQTTRAIAAEREAVADARPRFHGSSRTTSTTAWTSDSITCLRRGIAC